MQPGRGGRHRDHRDRYEPHRYEAQARLIDAVGTPRTTTVSIDALTIFGNDDFNAPIDFAATSFF